MKDRGMGSWPTRRAAIAPDRVALVEGDREVTYREVSDAVVRLATALRSRGVERGDRVAYLGLNSVSFVEVMFAVAKLGGVFLPLNTRLAPMETAYILSDAEPRILVWDEGFETIATDPQITELEVDVLPVRGESGSVDALIRDTEPEPIDEEVGLDDLFMIQYTSGTSGAPKGVMMTHGNIQWNVYNVLVDLDITSDVVSLVAAPMFHTAALNQLFLPTFLKGGTALIERKWLPDRAFDLIESRGASYLFGVTSMYQSLLQHPRWADVDLSRVTIAMSGGAPIPASLLDGFLERGIGISQGYGLTESSPGATMLRSSDAERKAGTAGTAHFFTDVRVVSPLMEDTATGERGEILIHGPNVSPGYWRRDDATAAAFTDGWLRTGDVGIRDEDGFITIVDRLKDMIISGGENIYPAEVEQAILSHPAVAEAAVIGIPDPKWGEVGRAVISLRPGAELTEDELLAHLDGRLAHYKTPKSVVIIDELPHTASGKLIKHRLKDEYGS